MIVYPRIVKQHAAAAIEADIAVHLIGTSMGVTGAVVMIALALPRNTLVLVSVVTYCIGLVAMLSFSATYNLGRASQRRDLLRRFDHAAIFVMIAGTYTPLTACLLDDASAIWLTGSMWLAALAGVGVKLVFERRYEWASTLVYLAMGWAGVVFMQPLLAALDRPALTLIVTGGVLYSIGACIHRWRRLPFHDAIWHTLVLVAASLHYAAILHAVVISP